MTCLAAALFAGLMQRLTVGVPSVTELDTEGRLKAMCDMYTREFAAK